MMMSDSVKSTLERDKQLSLRKEPWLDQYQLVGEYVHTRKLNFNETFEPGAFLNRDVFSSKAPKASKIAASSLLSWLWPDNSKRVRLTAPRNLPKTTENKKYYEEITRRVSDVMDNPKAGFRLSLEDYMNDQLVFGTSGVMIQSDPETKVRYESWGISQLKIAQGKGERVDTAFRDKVMTVKEVVQEYSLEKVSERVRDKFENKKYDEPVKVLIAIQPRLTVDSEAKGNKAMPWQSQHIEVEAGHLLRESGFDEMPVPVGRFYKLSYEWYGRSPGMDALPDILESNVIWEAVTIALEQQLNPPLGVLDDGSLGSGYIDTSAGAINVFRTTGRAGDSNPVFPLFTVGNIDGAIGLLKTLDEQISDHFFVDRLLDFNNEARMTLGEAQMRDRMKNMTLSSIFIRQITEVFSPSVERTFNVMFANKQLGVVAGSKQEAISLLVDGQEPLIIPPDVQRLMETGQEVYNIEYLTPAAKIMRSEEAAAVAQAWEFGSMVAQVKEDVLDNYDADFSARMYAEAMGVPLEMIRAEDKVQEIRAGKQQALEAQAQQDALGQGAEVARNIGQSGLVPTTAQQGAA